jgi:hypothetical protein
MRHLIIGYGNLGKDLEITLRTRGHHVDVSRVVMPSETDYDFVWCAAGSGGPGSPRVKHLDTNCSLTFQILDAFPAKTQKIFFSTHYLNQDPHGDHSFYAKTKALLEASVKEDANARAFRVGSLYGEHHPERTFPGKIIPRLLADERFSLPVNIVTPTPTRWLAARAIETALAGGDQIISLGPANGISVYRWGVFIAEKLSRIYRLESGALDPQYPADSSAGRWEESEDDCRILWRCYGEKIFFKQLHQDH